MDVQGIKHKQARLDQSIDLLDDISVLNDVDLNQESFMEALDAIDKSEESILSQLDQSQSDVSAHFRGHDISQISINEQNFLPEFEKSLQRSGLNSELSDSLLSGVRSASDLTKDLIPRLMDMQLNSTPEDVAQAFKKHIVKNVINLWSNVVQAFRENGVSGAVKSLFSGVKDILFGVLKFVGDTVRIHQETIKTLAIVGAVVGISFVTGPVALAAIPVILAQRASGQDVRSTLVNTGNNMLKNATGVDVMNGLQKLKDVGLDFKQVNALELKPEQILQLANSNNLELVNQFKERANMILNVDQQIFGKDKFLNVLQGPQQQILKKINDVKDQANQHVSNYKEQFQNKLVGAKQKVQDKVRDTRQQVDNNLRSQKEKIQNRVYDVKKGLHEQKEELSSRRNKWNERIKQNVALDYSVKGRVDNFTKPEILNTDKHLKKLQMQVNEIRNQPIRFEEKLSRAQQAVINYGNVGHFSEKQREILNKNIIKPLDEYGRVQEKYGKLSQQQRLQRAQLKQLSQLQHKQI